MRCGAKCFIVRFEKDNTIIQKEVTARTPAGARKVIKQHLGNNLTILSAQQKSPR